MLIVIGCLVQALIFSIVENGLISVSSDSLAFCDSRSMKGMGVTGLEEVTNKLCPNEIIACRCLK